MDKHKNVFYKSQNVNPWWLGQSISKTVVQVLQSGNLVACFWESFWESKTH